MGNSQQLDLSDMPPGPGNSNATNSEEALVHSLVAAAHATIAKVDPTNQTTRMFLNLIKGAISHSPPNTVLLTISTQQTKSAPQPSARTATPSSRGST